MTTSSVTVMYLRRKNLRVLASCNGTGGCFRPFKQDHEHTDHRCSCVHVLQNKIQGMCVCVGGESPNRNPCWSNHIARVNLAQCFHFGEGVGGVHHENTYIFNNFTNHPKLDNL